MALDIVSSQETSPEGLAVLDGIWVGILHPWNCVFVGRAASPLKYLPKECFHFSLCWQRSTASCRRGRWLASPSPSLAPPPPSSPSGCCPRSRRAGRRPAARTSEPLGCPHRHPPAPSTWWHRVSPSTSAHHRSLSSAGWRLLLCAPSSCPFCSVCLCRTEKIRGGGK